MLVPSPSPSSSSTATTNCSSGDSVGAQRNTSKEEKADKIEIPMLDPCSFSSPTQPLLPLRPWRRLSAPELGISMKNLAYCLLLLLPGRRPAVPSKTATTEMACDEVE
ncbi:hypothetical protein OsI_12432 [Oryza sativa Indica Group]|uniref:Uncharacterized protein n=1 Tax=Oryza sativa subsp. indica TaxID=39946 RepID=B8ALM6_ORYSI|nr:hypothetical protein OsI_12432 [Oryza sativa Indica Group]